MRDLFEGGAEGVFRRLLRADARSAIEHDVLAETGWQRLGREVAERCEQRVFDALEHVFRRGAHVDQHDLAGIEPGADFVRGPGFKGFSVDLFGLHVSLLFAGGVAPNAPPGPIWTGYGETS